MFYGRIYASEKGFLREAFFVPGILRKHLFGQTFKVLSQISSSEFDI